MYGDLFDACLDLAGVEFGAHHGKRIDPQRLMQGPKNGRRL